MRVPACCVLALAVLTPSSSELHQRYGTPNLEHRNVTGILESENFTIRPGVSVTATYGADTRVCQFQISPAINLNETVQRSYLTEETVSSVLSELTPLAMRGKEYGQGAKDSVHVMEYDNVLVIQKLELSGVSEITISFKREGCAGPSSPLAFPPPPDPDTVLRLTPDATDLRKKLTVLTADRDAGDMLQLRPQIRANVKYGPDSRACSIEIEPADLSNPYVPTEAVTQLLTELVPDGMKGKSVNTAVIRSSACGGAYIWEYENVSIMRLPNYCVSEKPNTEHRAIIHFKRDVCPKSPSLFR